MIKLILYTACNFFYNADLSLIISFVSLNIAVIALIYTVRTYILKKGNKVRGWISFASDINTNDRYPKDLILENLKDKPIVVFHIYLKIGSSYFIEIENFDNNPLIIKPFEVFRKKYDSIIMYSINIDRINLDDLIKDENIRKVIYLSTTDGKVKVQQKMYIWNPIGLFFKNHATAIIRIMRMNYKNKAYGENVDYLVEFIDKNNEEEVISLRREDYRFQIFKNFLLTPKALSSTIELELFLKKMKIKKKIQFERMNIIDFKKAIKPYYKDLNKIINAKKINWFQYYIIGKMFTIISNRKMDKENKRLNKK